MNFRSFTYLREKIFSQENKFKDVFFYLESSRKIEFIKKKNNLKAHDYFEEFILCQSKNLNS